MPLKWKIYYACSLYLLTWGIGFFIYVVYETLNERQSNDTIAYSIIALFITTLVICKAWLSLRALQHYNHSALYTRAGKIIFIISFCFIILFAVGTVLLSAFFIIPEDFLHRPGTDIGTDLVYALDAKELMLDVGFFIGIGCSIVIAVTDLVLLKAIKKSHFDNLLSFELSEEKP